MIFEKNSKILFIGDSISDYERARPVGARALVAILMNVVFWTRKPHH